ncbi:hypothetical protein Q5752_005709 [Cryptotrichosporon argae]
MAAPPSPPGPIPQTHPAFASAPDPRSSGSSSHGRPPADAGAGAGLGPKTFADVLLLIHSATNLAQVRDVLVPELLDLTGGHAGGGRGGAPRKDRGEELVALPKVAIGPEDVRGRSAATLFVLSARMKLAKTKAPALLELARHLCYEGDAAQLVLCSSRLAVFAWGIVKTARELDKLPEAIQAIEVLIARVVPPTAFTGAYAAYLEACLLAKNNKAGAAVLDIVLADAALFKPTYLDVLTYYHHAGLICMAEGERATPAVHFFTFAVAMPTTSTSAVQVACAKRAVLCEILHAGTHLKWPKWMPQHVVQSIDRGMAEYDELAKAFERRDWDAVAKKAAEPIFDTDCNRGLVDKILASALKWRIHKLRDTYSRLALAQLTEKCGLSGPEGEASVVKALEDLASPHASFATVQGDPAVVSFVDDEDMAVSRSQLLTQLRRQHAMADRLGAYFAQADRTLGIAPAWLEKQSHKLGTGEAKIKAEDSDVLMMDEVAGGLLRGVGSNTADVGF